MNGTNGGLHDANIIVLFGLTGSGKTTFANIASDGSMQVGHGLKSCTQNVEHTTMFTVDDKPVVLIDSPGFDDTYLSESEILKSVAGFLSAAYSQHYKVTGLLYFQKITDTRVGGASFRQMNMFKELCGTDSLKNVIYVTNMWSDPPTENELLRESELRHSNEFFGIPLAEGAQMARHYNKKESAYDIIRKLLPRSPTVTKISKELVDQGLALEQTSAGVALGRDLQDEVQKLNAEIGKLQEEHDKATREYDERFRKMLEQQEREAQERHKRIEQQIESLKQGHNPNKVAWEQELQKFACEVGANVSRTFERIASEQGAAVNHFIRSHEHEIEAARRVVEEGTKRVEETGVFVAQQVAQNFGHVQREVNDKCIIA